MSCFLDKSNVPADWTALWVDIHLPSWFPESEAANTGLKHSVWDSYLRRQNTLSGNAVAYGTAVASCDFTDTEWTSATFAAAYGAIYNDDQSDKLCVVLDFSGTKTCSNGTFTVSFPSPSTPADAIISMA